MAIRITCINKDSGNHYNPYEAIQYLGWIDGNKSGKSARLDIVKYIEKGNEAFVLDIFNNKIKLVVRVSVAGNKYVQTQADGKLTDNLLNLPECK